MLVENYANQKDILWNSDLGIYFLCSYAET